MTKSQPVAKDDGALRARTISEIEQGFSARSIQQRRLARAGAAIWMIGMHLSDGAKRAFDVAISGGLLLALAPILLFLCRKGAADGHKLLRSPRLGRWGVVFDRYSFSSGMLSNVPTLMNVWKGDMSIIGPRALPAGDVNSIDRTTWKSLDIRPGLFSVWWIRTRANTAYGSEALADAEYMDTRSFPGDLGIALRAVAASARGKATAMAPGRVDLMGIPINNLTMEEAIEQILEKCKTPWPSQVCFVNADCANIAWTNRDYADILRGCGLVFADGIGMKLAGKILNRNIKQNVNGTDMLPPLCSALERNGVGVFLLGGRPGVAADVALWMAAMFPGLAVRGHRDGYFTPPELPAVLEQIRQSGAEMLLVAFGVPMQEGWIRDHMAETGAKVNIGVGGLFDFYSGRIPRAPEWIREAGMEWLYRFRQEPRRMWRRYFVGNIIFMARVIREHRRSAPL